MGKRKKSSRKPAGPKKREVLATTFQCLFCNHENSVSVKIERKVGIGTLFCKICGQNFQTNINYLSAAVDVYSDWVDACDAVAKTGGADAIGQTAANSNREIDVSARAPAIAPSRHMNNKKESEMDDFVVDDEPDGEADFGGPGGYDDDDDDDDDE